MPTVQRTFAATMILAAFGLASEVAKAETKAFYLDRAQLSGAPNDGFTVWRPEMHDKTRFYAN